MASGDIATANVVAPRGPDAIVCIRIAEHARSTLVDFSIG
jgi:hypothetical protein